MNSQKLIETDEILERVDQLMSGKLKSPNTGLGDTAIVLLSTPRVLRSFSRLHPFHMKGNSYTPYRYSCILFNPSCSQMR